MTHLYFELDAIDNFAIYVSLPLYEENAIYLYHRKSNYFKI